MKNPHHRIYHCILLLLLLQIHHFGWAQEDSDYQTSINEHTLFGEGFANPLSPDSWAMIKYGNSDIDPYSGTLGITIPFYTYQDEDFTIPISMGYASNGYKPNIQSGILGLGWYLNVGGVITREVKGVFDEEGTTSMEIYNFTNKWNGRKDQKDPTVYGFGALYLLNDFSYSDYLLDYGYYGKIGEEYLPIYVNPKDLGFDPTYETRPDIFHFSFMGYTGSFILQPNRKVIVYDCNHPAKEISIDVELVREGFKSFVITTGDHMQYHFTSVEYVEAISHNTNAQGIRNRNNWKLTKIVAPNGREAVFEYGKTYYSYSYIPTTIEETYWLKKVGIGVGNDISINNQKSFNQYKPITNEVEAKCLTAIRINNRAKIEFAYSEKLQEKELGYSGIALKLDSINIYNSNSQIIKSCVYQYRTNTISPPENSTKKIGITFLSNLTISGEGTYSMNYNESGLTFPGIDTYSIDWYGYYNLSNNNFMPEKSVAFNNDNYLLTMRKPNFEATMYGMLTQITYPTGGYTKFEYEQNSFSNDASEMSHAGVDTPAAGLRISQITDYESDNSAIRQRKFSYVNTNGKSSGYLLWRPISYIKYRAKSSGYDIMERNTLTSVDDFPYSMKTHIEYTRVIEELKQNNNDTCTLTEYQYNTASDNKYKDLITNFTTAFTSELDSAWFYILDSLHNDKKILQRYESYSQSRIGGKLHSITKYTNDLTHPVKKCEYVYDAYVPHFNMQCFDAQCMCTGYLAEYKYSLETPYISKIKEQQYNENGELIIENITNFQLDDNFRICSAETTDSKGNILSNQYFYHPEVPAYLTEHICKRGDTITEATKFNFKCNANKVYLPSSCEKGLISSESPASSPTYLTDKTFDKYDSFGHPLQVTDKSGKSTCYIWGYDGQYVVAKIENIKYDELSLQCDIEDTAYPDSLPDSLEHDLRTLGKNIMVTTYKYKPLVGVQCITDASGRKTYYDYDKDGKLICVKDDKGEPIQSYQYNIVTYNNY